MTTKPLRQTAISKLVSLWPLRLYRVSGSSMEPTLKVGDLAIGWLWFTPRVGQIVVARTPERLLIKRISQIDGDRVWVEGDNAAASTDSRSIGWLDVHQVVAKIIIRL